MKYDVDYFIAKFEAIDNENWIERELGSFSNHCTYGHCGIRIDSDVPTNEAVFLSVLVDRYIKKYDFTDYIFENLSWSVVDINDGNHPSYTQSTPKQRILAALYDIREKELSEANLKAATIIVNTNFNLINYE